METITLVNLVANSIIVASLLSVIIKTFGNNNSPIWSNTFFAWISKLGLSLTIVGCVSNILTLTTPPVREVLMNMGLGLTFCWLAWFHIEQSIKYNKPKQPRKIKASLINKSNGRQS